MQPNRATPGSRWAGAKRATAVLLSIACLVPHVTFARGSFIAEPSRARGSNNVCERLEALCKAPGVIYVGPAASGRALELLGGIFEQRPLPPNFVRYPPGHVIVGVADLDRAASVLQLRIAYRLGYTVGVTDAQPGDVGRLRAGIATTSGCSTGAESPTASLAGFQQSSAPEPAIMSGFLFFSRDGLGTDRKAQAELDSRERQFLAGRFGRTPPTPVGLGSDDQCPSTENCLVTLAAATTCTLYDTEAVMGANNVQVNTAQLEVSNGVWPLRSLDNQEDFYFVAQDHELTLANPASYAGFTQRIENDLEAGIGGPAPGLVNPSPGTTGSTTTYTSGLQQTIGGSVGMTSSGTSANLTSSVAVSNSTSITMPETVVSNDSDLQKGDTKWQYAVGSKTETSTSFVNYWIWSYPRSGYGAHQATFSFSSTEHLGIPLSAQVTSETGFASLFSEVPLPFGPWTPTAPIVTGIVQNGQPTASVKAGTSFEIKGSGLYPATVQDVLLGGQVVSMPYPVSDTEITVVAPGSGVPLGTPIPVVVRTSQGFSNSDVTVTIVPD